VFDEKNLVSCAGLVPVMELAEQAGLSQLLDEQVRFTSERVRSGAANATPRCCGEGCRRWRSRSPPRSRRR
jgi:hypothetical protein